MWFRYPCPLTRQLSNSHRDAIQKFSTHIRISINFNFSIMIPSPSSHSHRPKFTYGKKLSRRPASLDHRNFDFASALNDNESSSISPSVPSQTNGLSMGSPKISNQREPSDDIDDSLKPPIIPTSKDKTAQPVTRKTVPLRPRGQRPSLFNENEGISTQDQPLVLSRQTRASPRRASTQRSLQVPYLAQSKGSVVQPPETPSELGCKPIPTKRQLKRSVSLLDQTMAQSKRKSVRSCTFLRFIPTVRQEVDAYHIRLIAY